VSVVTLRDLARQSPTALYWRLANSAQRHLPIRVAEYSAGARRRIDSNGRQRTLDRPLSLSFVWTAQEQH